MTEDPSVDILDVIPGEMQEAMKALEEAATPADDLCERGRTGPAQPGNELSGYASPGDVAVTRMAEPLEFCDFDGAPTIDSRLRLAQRLSDVGGCPRGRRLRCDCGPVHGSEVADGDRSGREKLRITLAWVTSVRVQLSIISRRFCRSLIGFRGFLRQPVGRTGDVDNF
jgi:hypothetical protein